MRWNFSTGWNKFKRIERDPTMIRLKIVQNYVGKLLNHGEINGEQKKSNEIATQIGRPCALPKTHKPF